MTQDETVTGGLCVVGIEPVSNDMVLAHLAPARDRDPWQALREQALAGRNCPVMPSTSDEAPGLLAYVAHHLGAHHSPDRFHGQQALSTAVSAPMAAPQRAAQKAVAQADETLTRGQEPLDNATGEPAKRGPGRPPQAVARLEQGAQDVAAARHEPQRLAGPREAVPQSIRAIGHASHGVALERGVRRNGTRMAGDSQPHIDTIRTLAQQENLSAACLDRLEQAARVVPTMQATSAFVAP